MAITEKEAKELCNSVEILMVNDSYPKAIKDLTPKKIFTRYNNSVKASEYWNKRYEELRTQLDLKRKAGKIVPLLPELKMEMFKKKSQLFVETAERFKKALDSSNWHPHQKRTSISKK